MSNSFGQSFSDILQKLATNPPLNISVAGLDSEGLILLPVTSKEFGSRATRIVVAPQTPELIALLPYCVILLNNTNREIGRYTLTWAFTDAQGKKATHTASYGNSKTLHSGDSVFPNTARLVSIVPRLGMSPGPSQWQISEQWDSWKDFYARQRSVVVTLDSVIFLDGQVLGSDSSASALLTEMQLRARREITEEVLGNDNGADLGRVRRALDQVVAQAVPLLGQRAGSSAPSYRGFMSAARHYKSAEQLLLLMRGMWAMHLLEIADKVGLAEGVQQVIRSKQSMVLPNVHR